MIGPVAMHPNVMDLTGRQFGRLVAIEYAGRQRWHCRCSCGADAVVVAWRLNCGKTKSCGCYQRECRRAWMRTHGHGHSPENHVWSDMIKRCTKSHKRGYHRYGGRGIKVCERWRKSFAAFLEDMGERPSPKHQLDRIDNDGDYEPGNCRWATAIEQNNNRKGNRRVTALGETLTVAEWARRSGLTKTAIYGRLNNGWHPEDAVILPLQRRSEQ